MRISEISETLQKKLDKDCIQDVVGDGNCLYRVFAKAEYNNEENWGKIKQKIINQHKSNRNEIITDKHIEHMSKDNEWGGEQEINAFCIKFDRDVIIIIIVENGIQVIKYNHGFNNLAVFIYTNSSHYSYYSTNYDNIDDFIDNLQDLNYEDDSEDSEYSDKDSLYETCSEISEPIIIKKENLATRLLKHSNPEKYEEFLRKNFETICLVIGSVQVGKTIEIIMRAVFLLGELALNVMIMVPPGIINQICNSLKIYMDRFYESKVVVLANNNSKMNDILGEIPYMPKIYVIGAHCANIVALNDAWEDELSNKKCHLIKDEADLYNRSSEKNNYNQITSEIAKFRNKFCTGSTDITATPYSLTYLANMDKIKAMDVDYIEPHSSYIGFGHSKLKIKVIDDMYIGNNEDFDTIYYDRMFRRIFKDFEKKVRELMRFFINITKIIAQQKNIKLTIESIYPNACFILANEGNYKFNNNGNQIAFTSMADSFNHFDNFYSTKQVHLFVISGKQTGRGINTRSISNKTNFGINDFIHTNGQIFDCVEDYPTSEMVQEIQRGVSGKFPGHEDKPEFTLMLYTTAENKKAVENQLIYDEMLKQTILKKENSEKYLTELIAPTIGKINPIVSKSRGIHRQRLGKGKDGLIYQTDDTYNSSVNDYNNNRTNFKYTGELTLLGSKILEMLKDLNGKHTTVKHLWDMFIERKCDTILTTKTPKNTISTTCSRLYDIGILDRFMDNGSNEYMYWIKQ